MNYLFNFLVTINFILLLSCNKNPEYHKSGNFSAEKENSIKILDSINVIALNDKYENQSIELYNADGSLWKSFKITDDFKDVGLQIAIKPDYYLLVLKCVGRKGTFYAVNVDYKKPSIKYIKAGLDYFNYEPWTKHIVKVPSVDFNSKINPIRIEPTNNATIVPYDEEQIYQPQEVKGKWLRIIDDQEKSGWIQWIDEKGNLLVEIYYLC